MTKTEYKEITAIMEQYGIDNRCDAGYFRRALKRGLAQTLANIRAKQAKAAVNAALPLAERKVKKAGYYKH